MRIYMQTPFVEGQALKFCHLILQQDLLDGWVVIREWGYQGARGRNRRDHFKEYAEAERAVLKSRDTQLKKGFRVVFMSGMEQRAQ
ncbi:MAG: WGR domain-containing protein [Proteobacteria bacterium]|nr:MAG: WGR domain-containing protein [Pseudomonadota bacterium]QKK10907.1 MAG: WGR domain-containing protein [Pseudomonadota bacterium]